MMKPSLCAAVMVCIAGCGGSSSGGNGGGGGGGGGNATTVTYTFTDIMPTAVATQIGTSAYTQATLNSGTVTINVPSGSTSYAVAYVCMANAYNPNNQEFIYPASIQDGTSVSKTCSANPTTALATVSVNAAAIPGAVLVSAVGQSQPWSGSTLTFSGKLPTGTGDVPIQVFGEFGQILAARILRSQAIPGALNGGNTVVFEASDETVSEPVTYSNAPSGFTVGNPTALYFTPGGAAIFLSSEVSTEYSAMPSASFQSGDYYLLDASAFSNTTQGEAVAVESFTSTAGAQAFTFPAPWSYSGPAAAAAPTVSLQYAGFAGMSNVSQVAGIQWPAGINSYDSVTVLPSANYQDGASSIVFPDLSNLTGFLIPASGTTIQWNAEIFQGDPFLTTPPSGSELSVQNSGTYTVP